MLTANLQVSKENDTVFSGCANSLSDVCVCVGVCVCVCAQCRIGGNYIISGKFRKNTLMKIWTLGILHFTL